MSEPNEPEAIRPIDPGARIGHVHLKVSDLARPLDFYCGILGFELMTTYGKHIHNIAATRHVPLLPLRLLASVVPTDRINHYSLDQVSKPMVLDISETRRLLDWEPTQSLEACLEELS